MRVSVRLMSLTTRALAESMDVHTMTHLARRLIRNYDLHKSIGFPRNIAVPNKDAASQIVNDIKDRDLFLQFVNLLMEIRQTGLMGRKYKIPYLRDIFGEITKSGFMYDNEFKMFIENPGVRKTRNWGVLREFEEYIFTFMRIDIVSNSDLVRQYPKEVIKTTYSDLRQIVRDSIEKRNGRIWNWEGDGGLIAFYFSAKNDHAVLSAMEIIHEIYIYNMAKSKLKEPIRVRLAVHSGQCEFRNNYEDIKSETITKIIEIESKFTKPDSLTVSSNVYRMLDHMIASQLKPLKVYNNTLCYKYELKWEN